MKKCLLTLVLSVMAMSAIIRAQAIFETEIPLLENEVWYGGAVGYGPRMPYTPADGGMDLALLGAGDHAAPLLLSSRGRYIRSDKPLRFEIRENSIVVRSNYGIMEPVIAGRTLRDAYMAACAKHFPPRNTLPDRALLETPIYDTGKSPAKGLTQEDIIGYAERIIAAGLPPGVIVIGDGWQDHYGAMDFRRGNFADPAAMTARLREMGFRVMLQVSPFVSPDTPRYRELRGMGYLLRVKNSDHPAIVRWSGGQSACVDMTNPAAASWLVDALKRVQTEYGIDGFRFDCDDAFGNMTDVRAHDKDATPAEHIRAWARTSLEFPLNETASAWNMGGEPVVLMLGAGAAPLEALASSVARATAAGLLGYAYVCPGVGDGRELTDADRKALLRSVQLNALMPVMRIPADVSGVLGVESVGAVKNAAGLRTKMLPYIMETVRAASQTGEPVIRHMEFVFPGEGFADCRDQYMLGDKYMVVPVLDANDHRDVKLPKGRWRDDTGQTYRGGTSISIRVPSERILYFERLN